LVLEHVVQPARTEVPFVDLGPIHAPLKEEILAGVAGLIDSGAFINGPQVARFEAEFADYCGVDHCVGLASGLDALRLALIASGIGPGDEVIVPAQTFVATYEAVTQAGATPVPVDISEADYNLDPDAVESAITPRTTAILPVHLYGQMADMRRLSSIAQRNGLALIEDACQAHGATRDGLRAGAAGTAGAFSFYPGKNLGAMGDAGALVTNDAALAEKVRALREHGQVAKYEHAVEGYTARLDSMQAAILSIKLHHLDAVTAERRDIAAAYSRELSAVDMVRTPPVAGESEPAWHLYVVRVPDPAAFMSHLSASGIASGRHYPQPPHLTKAYARLGYPPGSFPVAEQLAADCVSVPIFPGLSDSAISWILHATVAYFHG
jgi:dTDP-4-amino-4,6-dideoxygalactose transaminase